MNKIFLFCVTVLILLKHSSKLFAQDYMSLNKKELRIEHQKKITELKKITDDTAALNSKIKSLTKEINLKYFN